MRKGRFFARARYEPQPASGEAPSGRRLSRLVHLARAAGRVGKGQREEREEEAREAGDEEGRAPPEVGVGVAADDVAERGADRDGAEEDRVDAAALLLREVVGEEARGDRPVGGLADADRRARGEERGEALREPRGRRGEAPDEDAEGEEARARALVAEDAEERRGDHVDDDEAGHQRPGLRVGEAELGVAQALDERGDDEAVEVVEEVDERQDGEAARGEPGGHGAGRGPCGLVHRFREVLHDPGGF